MRHTAGYVADDLYGETMVSQKQRLILEAVDEVQRAKSLYLIGRGSFSAVVDASIRLNKLVGGWCV